MITKERARELRRKIEQASTSLTDESAREAVELFPAWQQGTAYKIGDRIRSKDTLYKCVQAHTSQADWTPEATPALWTKVSLEEYPEWIQPTGAQDAYAKGDKVTHKDKRWISTIDANVWEPSVYGWEEEA